MRKSTWAGVAMSFGASNKSKNGGVSELTGRLSNASGELAATEASLDKKGSFGLTGGIGTLALDLAFMEHRVLKFLSLTDGEEDEDGREVEMGICKLMAILFSFAKTVWVFFQCSITLAENSSSCGVSFCFTQNWL